MPEQTTAERVRNCAVERYIEPARRRGETTVQIVVGEIHKALQRNVIPNVCKALKGPKFLKEQGLVIESVEGPPSGTGSQLKITYRLNSAHDHPAPASDELPLLRLWGIG